MSSLFFFRYGTVESVRLRSLPLKDDGKLPRRAAVAAGALDEAGSANAYVVFSSGASAVHALAHNMREVCTPGLHACPHHRFTKSRIHVQGELSSVALGCPLAPSTCYPMASALQ